VELRPYKRHPEDGWQVTTWDGLRAVLPDIPRKAMQDVRHTTPILDRNRARCPDHPLWQAARADLNRPLNDLRSMAGPLSITQLIREERDAMLAAQDRGITISRAGLNGISSADLPTYVEETHARLLS
jgi:hypothetical protein